MAPQRDSICGHGQDGCGGSPVFSNVLEGWWALALELTQLFRVQWNDPELPGMDYRSSARLTGGLTGHRFAVERQTGGIPTAFDARSGSGAGPVVVLLAEFDALPGLDDEAVPSGTWVE